MSHPAELAQGTNHHLAKAFRSFVASRRQVSVALGGMATLTVVAPTMALPAMAAGTAMVGFHALSLRGLGDGPLTWKSFKAAFGKAPSPGRRIVIGKDGESRSIELDDEMLRQHLLVLGKSDEARRNLMLSICGQFPGLSSGFIFCDAKGDVSLYARIYDIARKLGREDDLLVLNMMTGNSNVDGPGKAHLSHTMNPFATGSADNLTQLVVSLMDDVGPDNAMWKGRATAMFTGVMRALTFLRDQGLLDLNVSAIRNHLNLRRIIDLCDPEAYPDMPPDIRVSVRSYLTSLPGYQEERRYKQPQVTLDQHGYLEMQFTKTLNSLADVYGHIFKTPYGEIDMDDVVRNRRILVVMLPALERSGEELANLGKIVVATLKGMIGASYGDRSEGTRVGYPRRSTRTRFPFLCALDGIGYYTVEGLALMAREAKAAGLSIIYAAQDVPAMKRLNPREGTSIEVNTRTRVTVGADGDPEVIVATDGENTVVGRQENADSPPQSRDLVVRTNHFIRVVAPKKYK